MKNKIIFISSALLLTACIVMPQEAYFNRGQPESLLSIASEEVTVGLDGYGGIRQLTDWIDRQSPSRARLVCSSPEICDSAAQILDQYNVPYEQVDGVRNQVSLSFENVEARDCENRFVTNHINPYNLNHTTFGCTMAVNQVQMVTDKNSFTDPKLLDQYDGQKAVQNYDTYISREVIDTNSESFSPASAGSQ